MKPFYIHINFNKPGKMPNKHPRAATVLVRRSAPNGADAYVRAPLRTSSVSVKVDHTRTRQKLSPVVFVICRTF